jgi:hypothetical protein
MVRFFCGISIYMDHRLHHYTCFTLVDITATGVTKNNDTLERNQHRNWETVLQTIGIGAQPLELQLPRVIESNLDYLEFGEFYQGTHKVWAFGFAVEHNGVFLKGTDEVGRLKEFFSQIPVICGLSETARFLLPIFYCDGAIKNIYFKTGSKDLNNI